MYHVTVIYADQSFREFDHVNKIEFYDSSAYQTLEGDAISSYRYMLGNVTYHLFLKMVWQASLYTTQYPSKFTKKTSFVHPYVDIHSVRVGFCNCETLFYCFL